MAVPVLRLAGVGKGRDGTAAGAGRQGDPLGVIINSGIMTALASYPELLAMPDEPITTAGRPDPVLFVNGRLEVVSASDEAEAILGYAAESLRGAALASIFPADTEEAVGLPGLVQGILGDNQASRRVRTHGLRHDGSAFFALATVAPLDSATGDDARLAVVFHERLPSEDVDPCGSYYDARTHLPSRHLFMERAEQAVQRLGHHERHAAVLLLDLDRFKRINNAVGHDLADQLLIQIGSRLEGRLRPGDTVARMGEDEFGILLNDIARAKDIYPLALRLLKDLEEPLAIAGQEIFLTASVGISVYPDDATTAPTLLRNASMALSRAKDPYRSNCNFFTEDQNEQAWQRLRLESDLNRALQREELRLFYQPVMGLASGTIQGMEALIRWQHPERGLVSPGDFIPLLEDTGLIHDVGNWVLQTAMDQLSRWQEAGFEGIHMNINLSPRQFASGGLADQIADLAEAYGLSPKLLQLEITESLFVDEIPGADAEIRRLNELGFPLALDDFGTGYSALNYLRQYPFDALKIDRSFLQRIPRHMVETALLRGIIDLADSLGIPTVAEGVENQEQADFLQWLGCAEAQGFGFSRPVPADDLTSMLRGEVTFPVQLRS